ncbi:MAG: ABC transporter ATP-binding protein, partial [Proteobacteria bacterium]|nr:ABC transporter ATP-binding protein [Pseudomonadota bacterium]
ARALVGSPKLIMLDEPSLGLAPLVVEEIFDIIRRINHDKGISILLVEQNANMALSIADHGYIMENGRIMMEGPGSELRQDKDIREFYLGLSETGDRKCYREIKHYKRRKRWLS